MNKYRMLALLLVVAALLSLAGCGSAGKAAEPTAAPMQAPTDTPAPTNTPTPRPTDAPTPAPTDTPAPVNILGDWRDNVYVNEYLGLAFRKKASWTALERDQLLEISGVAMDMLGDEALAEDINAAVEEGTVLYAMYASAPGGSTSCNLTLERLGALEAIRITPEDYIDASGEQLAAALTSMGLENVAWERSTVTISGIEMPCVNITASYSGAAFYETVAVHKVNSYMAAVSVSAMDKDALDAAIACWEPLA